MIIYKKNFKHWQFGIKCVVLLYLNIEILDRLGGSTIQSFIFLLPLNTKNQKFLVCALRTINARHTFVLLPLKDFYICIQMRVDLLS